MVILAEFDLIVLRGWLERTNVIGTRWHYEAVYALVLVAFGLALVCGRVLQRTMAQGDQPDTERDENNSCGRSPQ